MYQINNDVDKMKHETKVILILDILIVLSVLVFGYLIFI